MRRSNCKIAGEGVIDSLEVKDPLTGTKMSEHFMHGSLGKCPPGSGEDQIRGTSRGTISKTSESRMFASEYSPHSDAK